MWIAKDCVPYSRPQIWHTKVLGLKMGALLFAALSVVVLFYWIF